MDTDRSDENSYRPRTYHHNFFVKSFPYHRLCETKNILTVNRQFPGPTLHAHKWDTLVVNVYNQADHNITIHWHGVRQLRNPWSDGAAQITQCPIRPGQNHTYKMTFTSEEGTLWWHAHNHALRASVHGAIVVYPMRGVSYPFPLPHDDVLIVLGEWWKMDVVDVYKQAAEKGKAPMPSDAYTINGQPGRLYPCSHPYTYTRMVEQGKTYLLRIINAAMERQFFFAIASHRLTLVGVDGSYTKPLTTGYIMISPGQTMDILVHANQAPGLYIMSASPYDNGMGSMHHHTDTDTDTGSVHPMPATENATTAIFRYIHPSAFTSMPIFPSFPPSNDSRSANNFTCHIRSLAVEDYELSVLARIDERMFVTLSMGMMHSASMNNVSFVEPSVDILKAYHDNMSDVYEGDFPSEPPKKFNYTGIPPMDEDWPPEYGTKVKVLDYDTNVEIVFQATNIMSRESHPMHLHGHSFYVVGWGYGNFDPEQDPLRYNLVDPPKQSTVAVPKGGWATIRFIANNPGVWLLHCHFEHHHYKGMGMAFIVKDGSNVFSKMDPPPEDLPAC